MTNFESGRLIGQITGGVVFGILLVFCVYKSFAFLKRRLPKNITWLIPSGVWGFFAGFLLWLSGDVVSANLLKPWLNALPQGSIFQPIGWVTFSLVRLTGFFGFGLLLYACTGGLVHLFRKHYGRKGDA